MKLILIIELILFLITQGSAKPTFEIDYENNQFLKDGKPFRYIAGDLEYFKVPRVLWKDRLLQHKATGLNAIQTYIEWALHEPERGVYEFEGEKNITEYFNLIHELGFVVVLRIGPFIDAERDFGGLPYWLLNLSPNLVLRSNEPTYFNEVEKWFSVLLPKVKPLLYINSGPIISVQIENEYGAYYTCDHQYTSHLRDMVRKYLGDDVLLTTVDGVESQKCGKIDNVFATVDFPPSMDPIERFTGQREFQPKGPSVNTEFYTGWLDVWEQPHSDISTGCVAKSLDIILKENASVVLYPLHGGTSFGFMAGSNGDDNSYFAACVTNYDFDAPINDAGDPNEKYWEIRKVIGKYVELPEGPLPKISPKMQLPPIALTPVASIFDDLLKVEPIHSVYPQSFEKLGHAYGFVLYSTNISGNTNESDVLKVQRLGDRAQVFVDKEYEGTLSRSDRIFSLPIKAKNGSTLDILVENQGRLCYGNYINESKGLTSNATLGKEMLMQWNQYKIYSNWSRIIGLVENRLKLIHDSKEQIKDPKRGVPHFYAATFKLPNVSGYPLDTFLRLDGWTKGVAFINGFNLGRFWPTAGPQVTLYVPAHLFLPYPQENSIVVFEQENSPLTTNKNNLNTIRFVEKHVVNGTAHKKQGWIPKC